MGLAWFAASDPLITRRLLGLDYPYLAVAHDTLIGGDGFQLGQPRSILLKPTGLDAIGFGTQRIVGIQLQSRLQLASGPLRVVSSFRFPSSAARKGYSYNSLCSFFSRDAKSSSGQPSQGAFAAILGLRRMA